MRNATRCGWVSVEDLERRVLMTGAIWGDVVHDVNTPGHQLEGWVVYADLNHNGKPDAREPRSVTDSQGTYEISGLKPGPITMRVIYKPGWVPKVLPDEHPNKFPQRYTIFDGLTTTGPEFVVTPMVEWVYPKLREPASVRAGGKGQTILDLSNAQYVPSIAMRGKYDILLTAYGSSVGVDGIVLTRTVRTVEIASGRKKSIVLDFRVPDGMASGTYGLAATVVAHGAPVDEGITAGPVEMAVGE